MKEKNENDIEEMKKEIVIERLRQSSSNIKVSFGMSDGKFMTRDELIEQVENNTDIGKNIVLINLEYLKAFRRQFASRG